MTAQSWHGLAAENAEEVTGKLSALLRRRARRLLTTLLRPYRRQVTWALALIVIGNLAALAGPWLVGVAIDRGIPPLAHGRDVAPLAAIMAAFFVAVAVQAVATRAFILEIGRFGEGVVLELRRRLFAHFQRLPVAFHERYTSGPGHLPADLGHRLDLRPVRGGPRLAGVRGLLAAAGRRRACCCWTGRWAWWCWPGSARWRCSPCGSAASRRPPTGAAGRRSPT